MLALLRLVARLFWAPFRFLFGPRMWVATMAVLGMVPAIVGGLCLIYGQGAVLLRWLWLTYGVAWPYNHIFNPLGLRISPWRYSPELQANLSAAGEAMRQSHWPWHTLGKIWPWNEWGELIWWAVGYWAVVFLCVGLACRNIGKARIDRETIKGVEQVPAAQFVRELRAVQRKAKRFEPGIRIHPDVRLDLSAETEHIGLAGTTGSGKTQILNSIFKQARERGDQILLWDVKGDYTAGLVEDPNVYLVAPFDARSARWDVAADVRTPGDADLLAEAVFPEITGGGSGTTKFFVDAGRSLFRAIVLCLVYAEALDWETLSFYLLDLDEARKLLARYPAGQKALRTFSQASDQTQGIVGTLDQHTAWVLDMAKADAEASAQGKSSFSIREWVESGESSTLLLRFNVSFAALSRPLCSVLTSLAILAIIEQGESAARRVWFLLDEMANFPKVGKLLTGLTEARSFGARFVLAPQAMTHIYSIYGRHETETILGMCNNQIWLRANDDANSEIAAKSLGRSEEIHHQHSSTKSKQGGPGGQESESSGYSQALRIGQAVLPGEIMTLPRAREAGGPVGFLKIAGFSKVAKLQWRFVGLDKTAEPTVLAAWVTAKEERLDQAAESPGQDQAEEKKSASENSANDPFDNI